MIYPLSRTGLTEDIPTTLTDKIFQGDGVIDLLKDVSEESLDSYFDDSGQLMLGIDVNESATGNESADSQGIALEQIELVLTTTDGDFTFTDFYTSTTAMVVADGETIAEEYYVVFGDAGSNSITGSTSTFDIGSFDDVIYLDDISYTGEITGAKLTVTFLDTANTGPETNEAFFDYSNGFEDFAILGTSQANSLEDAVIGVADAPEALEFEELEVGPGSPPGAPTPPLILLLGLAVAMIYRTHWP